MVVDRTVCPEPHATLNPSDADFAEKLFAVLKMIWLYDDLHLVDLTGTATKEDFATKTGVMLRTSGTSGEPKIVLVDVYDRMLKLSTKVKFTPHANWRTLYKPGTWAHLSVAMHTLLSNSESFGDALDDAKPYVKYLHLALTPTQLRMLQFRKVLPEGVHQVTLGGEAAEQCDLDLAKKLFPVARISHVYASTEHGSLFSISDGLAGIPETLLNKHGCTLADDGELIISGEASGDIFTTDSAKARVHFSHRKGHNEEVLIIGGEKIAAHKLFSAIRAADKTKQIKTLHLGTANSALGKVLMARYSTYDKAPLSSSELRRQCAQILPKIFVPAIFEFEDDDSVKLQNHLARTIPWK